MRGERTTVVLERFGPPEVMRLVSEPLCAPGPSEVLVEVDAIGVNFADTIVRRGEYHRNQRLSFVPGFEAAGRVTATGPGVELAPGTPVAVFTENGGGYADHLVVPASRVYPVPDDISPVQVAGVFLQGVTAWYAVHRYGRVAAGEHVLVHAGAGGVGGLAIQLARLAGAIPIATASTEEKLRVARDNGAETALSSDPATLVSLLRQATGDRGCDVVVDGVGGPLFESSLQTLAHGGRYVVVGSASQEPAILDVRRLMPRAQIVCGFIVARVAEQSPEEPAAALRTVCELLREEKLRLRLTVLSLDEAVQAHELIEGRRHTGKIVLTTGTAGAEARRGNA